MTKSDFNQNLVSQTVWPWTTPARDTGPSASHRCKKAILGSITGYAMAALFYWVLHLWIPALGITAAATLVLFIGLFWPAGFAKIETGILGFAHAVGTGLTWLLLTPVFYLFFTTARVVLTWKGQDPLQRKIRPDDATYWQTRRRVEDPNYFQRQY